MCRMRLMPQGVQKQDVQVLQHRHRTLGNFGEIRYIRGGPETKRKDLCVPMLHRDWNERSSKQVQLAVKIQQFERRSSAELILTGKDVPKDLRQSRQRYRIRIQ